MIARMVRRLATAIVAPVMAFCMLHLRSLQVTDAKRETPFGAYLTLRLVMTTLALAIIGGVSLATDYGPQTNRILLAAATMAAIEALSDMMYGAMQQRDHHGIVARSMLLKGGGSIATFALVLTTAGNAFWALMAAA